MSEPGDKSTTSHDPDRWRSEFPILAGTNYLVNHSLGAMPRGVVDRLKEYSDTWAQRGVRAWGEGWWSSPVDVGNGVARLMNAPEGSVVMHQNVSVIEAIIASALDFSGTRNKVVYTDQNFPSVMYVWEAQRDRGARIDCVASDDGIGVPTERLLEAIDEETLVVPISHVCFKSSYLQDAKAICARAREVGAMVILDAYQSLGTVPFDVKELDVDMVCGGSVKWLCGGPGAAYLYVRPELAASLEPAITGWAAHAAPFAFEQGPQRYAGGLERMLHGTPAVVALMSASVGHALVREVGVDAIRAHSIRLTESLREAALAAGFQVPSPADPAQRGGTLTLGLSEDESGSAFVAALAARDIQVDHRPGAGLRVSPHFYTRSDELDAFLAATVELRQTRGWTEHVNSSDSY